MHGHSSVDAVGFAYNTLSLCWKFIKQYHHSSSPLDLQKLMVLFFNLIRVGQEIILYKHLCTIP